MRKILTRFASVFMALAMILLAIPTMQANADEATIKVHFKNTENWSKVYVYTWSPEAYGTWPGTDITASKDGDYYTATLKDHADSMLNIIFNDGNGTQTVDIKLDLTKGLEWWVVPSDNSTGKWACVTDVSKDKAESGQVEVFEPQAPSNPTIKKSPVIDGNKVTFYYECTNADTVVVAGDMNGWSMTDWTMTKDGNVYSYTCELPAGTYGYKFVVNGQWYADPMNSETMDDGFGGVNSSFTVSGGGSTTTPDPTPDPNPGTTVTSPVVKDGKVTFNFASSTATKVEVFGNFNDWASGFEMTKEGDVFTYTMELANGEYEYKFVVDGTEWINDPANSNQKNGNNVVTVSDGAAAPDKPDTPEYTPTLKESVVIDGNKVTIYYENPNVDKVEFMSSANDWQGVEMTKDGNIFSITLELEKGDYQYKFLLNGTDWVNDPLNPNTTGENSDNVFSITSDAPATPDTEEPGTTTPDTEEDKEPTGDTPAGSAPMNDGVIILISAIITIVVVLGGFAVYLFIKKKNA